MTSDKQEMELLSSFLLLLSPDSAGIFCQRRNIFAAVGWRKRNEES